MQATSTPFKTMVEGADLMVAQKITMTLPLTRVNLCLTPSFEYGLGAKWTGIGSASTLSVSTAQAFVGTRSMRVVFPTAPSLPSFAFYTIIPARQFATYTVSAMVWIDPGGPGMTIYNGTGGNVVTATGSWQRIFTTLTSDSVGHLQVFIGNVPPSTAGQGVYIDAVLIEEGSVVGSYFDGSFANASWRGAPEDSPSVLDISPYSDFTVPLVTCRTNRAITTDMPDGTRLTTGYPSASADFTLGGPQVVTDEGLSAADVLNPYNSSSPLYRTDIKRSPVVIQEGLYPGTGAAPELVTTFTGLLDNCDSDPVAGTAQITCVDNRSLLRTLPKLPPVAATMDVPHGTFASPLLSVFSPGLRSSWVIDALLRANNILSSPGQRAACKLYASLAGSAYPTLYSSGGYPVQATNSGQYNVQSTSTPMLFVPGAFNSDVCRDVDIYASLATNNDTSFSDEIAVNPGEGYFVEWWMYTALPDTSVTGLLSQMSVQLQATDGHYGVNYSTQIGFTPITALSWTFQDAAGSNHTVTTSGGWQQFSVAVSYSGTFPSSMTATTTLWIDRVLVNTWSTSIGAVPSFNTMDAVSINSEYPMEAFQITAEAAGSPAPAFVPDAFLDASLNALIATVPLSGDPWQIVQQLAEAESAIAGFDELGIFRFTNRNSLAANISVRTVSSQKSLKTVHSATDASTFANRVTANVNVLSRSAFQAVWSASAATFRIESLQTKIIVVNATDAVVGMSTLIGVLPIGGITPTNPISGYRAARLPDGTGGQITDLTMQLRQLTPTQIQITIQNPHSFPVFLVTPSNVGYPVTSVGQPALAIGGEFIQASGSAVDASGTVSTATAADSQWPPAGEGGAASSATGEVALTLPDNPWRQDLASCQSTTDDNLSDLYRSRPMLTNISLVADPRLQLIDRVTLLMPEGFIDDDVILTQITTTTGSGQWDQTVNARAVAPPGAWVMGAVGRSEMGVATYV